MNGFLCKYFMLANHTADLHGWIFISLLRYGIIKTPSPTRKFLKSSLSPSCFHVPSNPTNYFADFPTCNFPIHWHSDYRHLTYKAIVCWSQLILGHKSQVLNFLVFCEFFDKIYTFPTGTKAEKFSVWRLSFI